MSDRVTEHGPRPGAAMYGSPPWRDAPSTVRARPGVVGGAGGGPGAANTAPLLNQFTQALDLNNETLAETLRRLRGFHATMYGDPPPPSGPATPDDLAERSPGLIGTAQRLLENQQELLRALETEVGRLSDLV